jgi:hypothetical protein
LSARRGPCVRAEVVGVGDAREGRGGGGVGGGGGGGGGVTKVYASTVAPA